jgi:multidrug efflux pump subunit AcrA (membrane-fusion protein)
MKRTIITTVIIVVVTLIALIVFNKVASKKDTAGQFTEASSGRFEITINTTGELIAEKSIDIKGPEISAGHDVRATNIKITDLVPEGTEVKAGDYVATLDRSEFDNNLKDAYERLTQLKTQLEMALLDTALTMNNIRDQISNQVHTVAEREMTFRNSQYESPPIIRQAEINLDQSKRVLDQLRRTYTLREAQTRTNIRNLRWFTGRIEKRIRDYEELLAGFYITAPSDGMIIYKRDRFGRKRKSGGNINTMDRVVATLPDLTVMISKVYISEIDITKIKPGQNVAITVDAFPAKSYSGVVSTVANIGEKLNNTDTKVFEVLVKINGTDMNLRPSMTTNNKIMIRSYEDVVYVPNECVHTGTDSIPFIYTKSGYKQAVALGESNDKEVIIEKGLKPGTEIYLTVPEKPEKFKYSGEELIEKGSR